MVYDIAVKGKIGQYWIDANDIKTEGTFVYSDGRNITYQFVNYFIINKY